MKRWPQFEEWVLHPWHRVPRGVWMLFVVYCVVLGVVCWFQYAGFMYHGSDLAIFDQVVWNMSHGRLFEYSFNPYSYLVDHRSWLLLPLSLLYIVAAHPITLLVVQTLVLASGVFPFILIVKRVIPLQGKKQGALVLAASAVYLFQPSIQSMNVFEFHMLPLVIPLSLWLWWSLIESRRLLVAVFLVLLFLVREDVALMTAGLGVLLILSPKILSMRRTRLFGIGLLVGSIVWFGFMVWVGALFSPEGSSKFFVFYDWLGSTPAEGLQFFISHPVRPFMVLLGYDHLIVILFAFAMVGFMPALRLRYLLPALGPLLLYLFIDQQMLSPVLKSHYASVIVPWFLIAGVYGYKRFQDMVNHGEFGRRLERFGLKGAAGLLVLAVVFSQWVSLGPQWTVAHRFKLMEYRNIDEYIVSSGNNIGNGEHDHVMMSERLYSHSGHTENLYPTLHLFTGKQHFSAVDYRAPAQVDYVFLEHESILRYGINLPLENRTDAHKRLQSLIKGNVLAPGHVSEDIISFLPESSLGEDATPLVTEAVPLVHSVSVDVNNDLTVLGWEYGVDIDALEFNERENGILKILMKKNEHSVFEDDQHIELVWWNTEGEVIKSKMMALGFGLYPSHSWEAGSQRVIHLPIEHPYDAAAVELRIAPLTKKFGPLFTLWRADPILDPQQTVSLSLPGIAPLDETTTAVVDLR